MSDESFRRAIRSTGTILGRGLRWTVATLVGRTARRIRLTMGIVALAILCAGIYVLLIAPFDALPSRGSELGSALLAGALIAGTILLLEIELNANRRRDDEQRQKAADRRDLIRQLDMRPDLKRLDLRNEDLTGARFWTKEMSQVMFDGAVLVETNFHSADLSSANLSKADCTGAVFTGAQMTNTYLLDTVFRNANLIAAHVDDADINGADFSDASMGRVRMKHVISSTGVRFERAMLFRADFEGATLPRSDFSGAYLKQATFERADCTDAIFDGADLAEATFNQTSLNRARFHAAGLKFADFAGAELTGADFSEADLTNVSIDGAAYDGTTKWPPGFDPKVAGALRHEDNPNWT